LIDLYILDTDISIELLRGRAPSARVRLRSLPASAITTTSITVAELHFGALRSQVPETSLRSLREFLSPLTILPFDESAAYRYGDVKQFLTSQGQTIGRMDMLIAAVALFHDAILLTNNEREFVRVPGLRIANWLKS
jgi:tRNA(fMet)-specific endonuclease VapC